MLDHDVLLDGSEPALDQGLRVCLSSVLELPVDDLPAPGTELDSTIAILRTWLAERGFGLVPVANASGFQWAGYWIAVTADPPDGAGERAALLMFGTPPGVVLSPQTHSLVGRPAADLRVEAGYVVAPLDPVQRTVAMPPSVAGRVEVVAVAAEAEAPMRQVTSAQAVPGRGLKGDRYAEQAGTFTPRKGPGTGHELTLVEAETLDSLDLGDAHRLGYLEARRNVVTRGIDLNSLVGRRFRVGDVECVGRRLCEPCAHLERLTHPGVLRGLIHRGGLRADILTSGTVSEGDVVEALSEPR